MYDPIQSGVTTFKREQLLADIRHLYLLRRGIQETDRNVLPSQYI